MTLNITSECGYISDHQNLSGIFIWFNINDTFTDGIRHFCTYNKPIAINCTV